MKEVEIKLQPFEEFQQPTEKSILIMNPPYGERISSPDILGLYKMIGERLKHQFVDNDAYVLSFREECFEQIGLRPSLKTPLFNGSLECELRKYQIFSGKYKEIREEGREIKTDEERKLMSEKRRFKTHRDDFKRRFDDDNDDETTRFRNRDRREDDRRPRHFGRNDDDDSRGRRSFDRDRKPFDRERRSFDRDRKPFDSDRKPFDRERKSFDRDRKPYDSDRKPFNRERRSFDRDRSSFDRGNSGNEKSGRKRISVKRDTQFDNED